MILIVTVIHVMVALGLILVVLLQRGSGADMGAAFGGSSQSVFGAAGTGTFLGKLTAGLATLFMITSLFLAFVGNRSVGGSVMEGAPVATQQGAEQPAAAPAATDAIPTPPTAAPAESAPAGAPATPNLPAMPEGDALPTVPKGSGP